MFLKELIKKRSKSKECDICHYSYFLNEVSNFQPYVCNRYHDLLIKSGNLNDIAILKTKNGNIFILQLELAKMKL